MPKKIKEKIVIAMSGGVDSSVAACLLKKQGFEVVGITLKLFCYKKDQAQKSCCSLKSIQEAKEVCAKLNIPHYVIGVEKEFEKNIIKNFIDEYLKGRTPNPCVRCNELIKFGSLLKKVKFWDADYLATGHYVRIKNDKFKIKNLYQAKDKDKDQSYFLYRLTQNQLKYVLFPLGNYTKEEVRELARKFALKVAEKPGSQEVCFIRTTYQDFLKEKLGKKFKKGAILDLNKQKIGQHNGLPFYTVGQRAGLGGPGPYYVVKIDVKKNILIVTNKKNDPSLYASELLVKNITWLSGKSPKLPLRIKARIRYRQIEVSARIRKTKKRDVLKVEFSQPQRAVTSGQSCVFYAKNRVLGGGIII